MQGRQKTDFFFKVTEMILNQDGANTPEFSTCPHSQLDTGLLSKGRKIGMPRVFDELIFSTVAAEVLEFSCEMN